MNFCRRARCGNAGDFRDPHGLQPFQIKKDHLLIERPEFLDQRLKAFQHQPMVGCCLDIVVARQRLDRLQAHPLTAVMANAPHHVRSRRVMRHAEGPGSQGATSVKDFEAAPQGGVDILEQVAAQIEVSLVCRSQAFERPPEFGYRSLVEIFRFCEITHSHR